MESVIEQSIEYDNDIIYNTTKYIIKYEYDENDKLVYSFDKIMMTDNWLNELYDIVDVSCVTGCEDVIVATDIEYSRHKFNRNNVASILFGKPLAGNVVFYFNHYMNQDEINKELKNIKNYLMRNELINWKNINDNYTIYTH